MRLKSIIYSIPLLVSLGCAPTEQVVQRRYFWPPLPDTPRIEYLASYWSADDFTRSAKQMFLDTFTGSEPAMGLEKPWGIASNGEGKVYIVDTNLRNVVVFDLRNYTVELLGKGAYAGLFFAPVGIALDGKGNIYVSDPKMNKVFSFTNDEKPLHVLESKDALKWPTGMALNDVLGRLYVVNSRDHNITVFNLEGKFLFTIGKRGYGDGEFNFPTDVDIDSKGNLVVADSMNARVQILDPDGKFIKKFGQRGDGETNFQIIKGIAVSRNDDVYVVDGRADRILVFNENGDPLTSIGATATVAETMKETPGGFLIPQDIDIDKNDTIFVVDSMNKRFQSFQIINDEWLKKHPIVK